MGDKFQDKIIQSDIDEDIVYKENKKERYSLILDKMNEEKTPSSSPSISLTPQSYVNKNSLPDNQTSVIEYVDEKADLSRHDAGSTIENLEKLKYFWNSSVGLIADFILNNFQNSYLDDESNIIPKKDGKQLGKITKRDIIAADAEETNEVGNAVRPLTNIDGETYDRVRNQDYDLKKDSNGNDIPYPYGLADKSRDLFNLPIEGSNNLTYTRRKEENSDNNYGTRLIMPKNVRRVEIEDLNRNFWVIAQSIMTIGNYIFEDGPFSQTIQAFSSEIIQLWENTLYLWIRVYYEHNRAAKDNIILTLPVPADGVLTSNKYNNYYVIPDSDSGELIIGGERLPEEDEIKVIIINRLSYLIDKYPQSNICVIPYIRLNNYKHNYFTSIYYPGVYFYLRKQNRAYFRFFRKNTEDRFIIKYDDYCSMLAAISQDQNEYLYPASLTEFYLEDKSTPFYAGIRPQITEETKIEITNDGYILKNFSLQLWDMVDSANKQRWSSTSCLVIFEAQDINLLDEKEEIYLSSKIPNEERGKREKSKNITQTYGAEYPYYLGEIPSKRRRTSKDGNYRVINEKPQVSVPEKVRGGFTAPLFLFNDDFKDNITINKTNDNINFEIKVEKEDEKAAENLYYLEYIGDSTDPSGATSDPYRAALNVKKTLKRQYINTSWKAQKIESVEGYLQKIGIIREKENYKYWSTTGTKRIDNALQYLIDNYKNQVNITVVDPKTIPFNRKNKDITATSYYKNLSWYFCQYEPSGSTQYHGNSYTLVIDKAPDKFQKSTNFSNSLRLTIQQNFKTTVNNIDDSNIIKDFPLTYFYNYFIKKKKVDKCLTSEIEIFPPRSGGTDMIQAGNDINGDAYYSMLAFFSRYHAQKGINYQGKLPFYWQYIFDNDINKMSIYNKDETINSLAGNDEVVKTIIGKTYQNKYNFEKIHPFFSFSKSGINFTATKTGYTAKLTKEYLNRLVFFIEEDYLSSAQIDKKLVPISNSGGSIIGYTIEWDGLDIDLGNLDFDDIVFDTPEFFQYFEATKLSSSEQWYQDFFKSLPRDAKYPDTLNNYIDERNDEINHYYIEKTKTRTRDYVEKILNDNNNSQPEVFTENEYKNNILKILKREIGSELVFPFTYKNKKYKLTLTTGVKDGKMVTQSSISVM